MTKKHYYKTPFAEYFRYFAEIDKGIRYSEEYGSILFIAIVEEVGEMARAYLAEHGRKKTNLAAQRDEQFEQELGDLLVAVLRLARIKKINLHERVMYSLQKIEKRKQHPKQ